MKNKFEPLTDEQMQKVNGGDGIIAYDPQTGEPFPEETGGYQNAETDRSRQYDISE